MYKDLVADFCFLSSFVKSILSGIGQDFASVLPLILNGNKSYSNADKILCQIWRAMGFGLFWNSLSFSRVWGAVYCVEFYPQQSSLCRYGGLLQSNGGYVAYCILLCPCQSVCCSFPFHLPCNTL